MVKYFNGSIFHSNIKNIVNTVNCDGYMGAGIALEFKIRYPEYFLDYEAKAKSGKINVGKIDYYFDQKNTIISFPTKNHYKYLSKLEWIENGLIHFVQTYKEMNITEVAFPKLGTSNGGLNWDEVKTLMEKYLNSLPIDVLICLDNEVDSLSDEYKIIQRINRLDYEDLIDIFHFTSKQADNFLKHKPIKRLRDVLKIPAIGERTYTKVYYTMMDDINNKKNIDYNIFSIWNDLE